MFLEFWEKKKSNRFSRVKFVNDLKQLWTIRSETLNNNDNIIIDK